MKTQILQNCQQCLSKSIIICELQVSLEILDNQGHIVMELERNEHKATHIQRVIDRTVIV